MKVNIKRIENDLPLPEYKTPGAAAFDIYTRVSAEVEPGKVMMLPTNLVIATPPGYVLKVYPRSSSAAKKGLNMANGVGVIDSDFCGDGDEINVLLYNFGNETRKIERGERIAQGVFLKVESAVWNEVEKMEGDDRGGFGSTGL